MLRHQLLTIDEVASVLDVSTETLARWRRTRAIELPYLTVGNKIRYRLSAVDDFLLHAMVQGDDEFEFDAPDDWSRRFGSLK